MDQRFALRLYSAAIERVITGSFTDWFDELLQEIARPTDAGGDEDTRQFAKPWREAGLLHKTIRRGLLHFIGVNLFWSEVAGDKWETQDDFDTNAFLQDFSMLVRIANHSAINVPEELLVSLKKFDYCIDQCFEVNQAEIKNTSIILRNWVSQNFEPIVGVYVDDFANRALHNRQLCQEISLLCVSALGLLFSPDNAAATNNYIPNKGRRLFQRKRWPSWVIKLLSARERGKCARCTVAFSELTEVHHIDHIVPLIEGGSNDISNLQLLCSKCNLEKKDSLVTVHPSFRNYVQVGEKTIPQIFDSLPPDHGGWYHPEHRSSQVVNEATKRGASHIVDSK